MLAIAPESFGGALVNHGNLFLSAREDQLIADIRLWKQKRKMGQHGLVPQITQKIEEQTSKSMVPELSRYFR